MIIINDSGECGECVIRTTPIGPDLGGDTGVHAVSTVGMQSRLAPTWRARDLPCSSEAPANPE